jgi:hypothetical protein
VTFVGADGTVELTAAVGIIGPKAADASELPAEFIAETDTYKATPFTNPVIVTGEDELSTVVPLESPTRYPVITAPPFDAGALNDTVILPSPATAATFVGTLGGVATVGVRPSRAAMRLIAFAKSDDKP